MFVILLFISATYYWTLGTLIRYNNWSNYRVKATPNLYRVYMDGHIA